MPEVGRINSVTAIPQLGLIIFRNYTDGFIEMTTKKVLGSKSFGRFVHEMKHFQSCLNFRMI